MAADPTLSVRVSELQDPSVLFERFNTEQIRRIERRVRGDIEQKKEELRQMVGERYRDLIDAADTIGEMSRSSASLVRSITDLDRYCHSLKRVKGGGRGPEPGDPGEKTQWRCSFFRTAAQLRLLLEIPERVWSAVEACQYLTATQLYLLSVHLQAQLQLDAAAGGHYAPILARFPILVRQVSTTGHFRSTILLDSRSLLRGRAVSDQAIAEALVSIMLLEDSSPRQALADFLLARKASIHQLLNAPQHGAGVKGQVCSLVELLVTTLFQTYAVFYLPPEGGVRQGEAGLSCGMLFSILENVTSTTAAKGRRSLQEDLGTGSWFRYLPTSITEFQPALRTLAQPIQREQLRDALQQWMDTCKEDICGGVSSLLVYVKSLKGLASIRDAVWDLLSSESISQHWSSVCQRLLEHQLPVWDDFLQQLFLQRLQTITREEMEAISLSSVQLLSSALRDLESQTSSGGPRGGAGQYEVDVASFLWSESSSDLLSDAGWVSVGQRGAQRSGLAMKTQALTPCVQNFCSSLDDKMKTRLDDLQHYLPPPADSRSGTAPGATGPPSSSFDRFTDLPAVEEALREGSLACVRHILNAVRSELAAAPVPAHLTSVLFLARLCQSLGALCSNLKHCVLGKELCVAKDPSRPGKKLSKVRAAATTAAVSPAHTQWSCLEEELLSCSMEAYHMWSSALCRVLLEKFSSALRAETAGAILTTSTNWEDLEIQEEAESGSSITSRIRLPVQPSWFVQALLFQLCVEVNRVGGHALPRPTLQQLLHECLVQVLQLYEDLKEDCSQVFPMTQIRSLQMLFDLRFLHVTLSSRKDESRSSRSPLDPRFLELCDWLESFIDPFDLDVFTPPLNANLNRLTQRTSVLLGLLTGSERPAGSRSSSSSSTTTPQESYNILPLASSQIRFGLLPLSMSNVHKPKSTARGNTAPPPAPPPADSSGPGSAFRQLVAQDDDTAASHSLFKLSWLSGIK